MITYIIQIPNSRHTVEAVGHLEKVRILKENRGAKIVGKKRPEGEVPVRRVQPVPVVEKPILLKEKPEPTDTAEEEAENTPDPEVMVDDGEDEPAEETPVVKAEKTPVKKKATSRKKRTYSRKKPVAKKDPAEKKEEPKEGSKYPWPTDDHINED